MAAIELAEARAPGHGGLTRDVIVEAAIEVIDTTSLAGLTMRRLGAALGVDAMAVYGYFENKAALLDAVVEHKAARLGQPPDELPADPVEAMLYIAAYLRRVLLEHPNLAPIVASRPLPQQRAPAIVHFGVQMFQQAGFTNEDIPVATDALVTFVLGFILQESGRFHALACQSWETSSTSSSSRSVSGWSRCPRTRPSRRRSSAGASTTTRRTWSSRRASGRCSTVCGSVWATPPAPSEG